MRRDDGFVVRRQTFPERIVEIQSPGFIYFIQAGNGPVKIGRANDVDKRLAALQTANYEELVILRTAQGGVMEEAALHRRFEPLRIRGEWYRYEQSLQALLGVEDLEREIRVVVSYQPMACAHCFAPLTVKEREGTDIFCTWCRLAEENGELHTRPQPAKLRDKYRSAA